MTLQHAVTLIKVRLKWCHTTSSVFCSRPSKFKFAVWRTILPWLDCWSMMQICRVILFYFLAFTFTGKLQLCAGAYVGAHHRNYAGSETGPWEHCSRQWRGAYRIWRHAHICSSSFQKKVGFFSIPVRLYLLLKSLTIFINGQIRWSLLNWLVTVLRIYPVKLQESCILQSDLTFLDKPSQGHPNTDKWSDHASLFLN